MLGLFVLDSNQCKASKAGMISAVLALIYRGLVGFALWHFAASHNGLTGGPVLAIQCCAKQSGAAGCLTLIAGDTLGRNDCMNNAQCIIPILRYHGMRPSVDAIAQDVHAFFQMSRPRAKPAIKSCPPALIAK